MNRKTISLAMIVISLSLLISVGSVYQVDARPPEPDLTASSTPTPFADKAIKVDGVKLVRPATRSASLPTKLVTTLMSQDFEGVWPASGWTLSDLSTGDGGEFLWGKRDCRPHTGSFGGWSVGGGAQGSALPCSAQYPTNTFTWAVYGPFSLVGVGSANLQFHLWGRTEGGSGCPFDYFFAGNSINGTDFSGTRYCGDWTGGPDGNGYYSRTLDLSSRLGQAQVWVAVVLKSDNSINDIGMTIDDLLLTADSAPTATPTATPVGQPTVVIHLPLINKDPTPTFTPTPTRMPTATPTPGGSNQPPRFPRPFSASTETRYRYDPSGRLIGATTTIIIPPATDPDGDPLTYVWSVSNGNIEEVSADGLTMKWNRLIQFGRVEGGTATVVVSDGRGGTDTAIIEFR